MITTRLLLFTSLLVSAFAPIAKAKDDLMSLTVREFLAGEADPATSDKYKNALYAIYIGNLSSVTYEKLKNHDPLFCQPGNLTMTYDLLHSILVSGNKATNGDDFPRFACIAEVTSRNVSVSPSMILLVAALTSQVRLPFYQCPTVKCSEKAMGARY